MGDEKDVPFMSISNIVAATEWVNGAIRINQDGKDPFLSTRFLPTQATFCVIVESFVCVCFFPSLPFGSDREKSISRLE